jgi:hypothetical protein
MELLDLNFQFVSVLTNACGSIVNVCQYHNAYIEQRYCTVLRGFRSIIGSEMSESALLRPILGKWSRMELLDLDLEFVTIISNTCGSIVNVYQYHHAYI